MGDRRLFQIWENRTLPAATWARFVEKTREAGSTPARVLRQLIEDYTARPATHDPTPPTDDRPE